MEIKTPTQDLTNVPNATVLLKSGEHLSVGYIDPKGTFHCFNISAQHLVFMAYHEGSENTLLIRPGAGCQFVAGQK